MLPIVILFCAGVWFTYVGGTAYLFALYLESKWEPAHPETRGDLEKYLHLYNKRQIKPKESMWGNEYALKPNERMIQYHILWNKRIPLDVVYDSKDNIIEIFTSYE